MAEPRKSSIASKAPVEAPAKTSPQDLPTEPLKAPTPETTADVMPNSSEVIREAENGAAASQAAGEAVFRTADEARDRAASNGLFFADEAVRLTTRNFEALIICSSAAAKAAGNVTQQAVEFGQRKFQHASTTLRSLSEARSATELLTLQTEYVQSFVEDLVEESCRLSDSAIRMFGEVMEPMAAARSARA
jgi:hypothetical protein